MDNNFHNALGGNSADQLRAYVQRVERIELEISECNDMKKEVYKEAKACGFCKDTLRKVIMRRRKQRSTIIDSDDLLQLYEMAILSVDPINV